MWRLSTVDISGDTSKERKETEKVRGKNQVRYSHSQVSLWPVHTVKRALCHQPCSRNVSLGGKRLAFVSPYKSVSATGSWDRKVIKQGQHSREGVGRRGCEKPKVHRVTRGHVH